MRGRYGPAQAGQNQEKYGIPRFAKAGVKQYPLIDCHKGTSAVEKMMSSDATRKKFISDAVAKMKEQKFHGYNLDIELGAPAADGKLYSQFVGEFGKALHAAGGKLSSDIGGCPSSYMGMTCEEYSNTTIDNVMSMSTYTHDPASFQSQIKKNEAALGGKYSVGIDTGFPAAKLSSALASAFTGSAVAIWANSPSPAFMAAIGEWLHA